MTTTVLSGSTQVVLAKIDGSNASTAIGTGTPDWAVEDAYDPTRTLLKIDTSSIPSTDTVSAVTFSITGIGGTANATYTLDFLKLLADPTLTQATWNNRNTATAWATGGAFDSTDAVLTPAFSIASFLTGAANSNTSAGLIALIQDWVTNTGNNKGLLLKMAIDPSNTGAYLTFGRPTITVTHAAGGGGATVSTITGTTVTEAGNEVFTVTMSGTGGGTFAYSWSGTATSADYTTTLTTGMCAVTGGSGSVTVSGSNITVDSTVTAFTVTVPTTTDTLDEADETIRLVIGGVTSSSGTITDDDAAPTITGTASSTVTAGSPVVITYSPGLSGQTRTYTLAFTDGTAVGGTDYDNTTVTGDFAVTAGTGSVSISGSTVTVDPGVTEFTLTITTTA